MVKRMGSLLLAVLLTGCATMYARCPRVDAVMVASRPALDAADVFMGWAWPLNVVLAGAGLVWIAGSAPACGIEMAATKPPVEPLPETREGIRDTP
jgi:hypothetical protein